MAVSDHVVKFLLRWKWQILAFWFAVQVVSTYYCPALFKCFEVQFKHDEDTESGRAAQALQKGLTDYQDRMEDVVVVSCDDCKSVVGAESRRVMNKLAGWIEGVGQRYPGLIKSYESYYDLEELPSNPYLSEDKKTMVFHWSFTAGQAIREGFDLFNTEVQNLNQESSLDIVSAGPYANFRGAERTMMGYIVKDNLLVVPFIGAILWFMLGSVKRSIVPFVCAAISISATWSTLLFIKRVIWPEFNMIITLPFITCAFAVALCVDYGLFLWGRFGEERAKGVILEEAICLMLGYSGHVVVISGMVMMFAYFSLLFYPHGNSIQLLSVGIGNMAAAFWSILTSLTITPCVIAAFPQQLDSDTSEHERLFRRMKPGKYWKKWAAVITRPPWIILVPLCTYLLMAPASLQLQNYKESFNTWSLLMSHGTAEYKGHARMENAFPRGSTMPMMVALQLTDHHHPSALKLSQKTLNLKELEGRPDAPLYSPKAWEKNPLLKLVQEKVKNSLIQSHKTVSLLSPNMWRDMAKAVAASSVADKGVTENLDAEDSGNLLKRKSRETSLIQVDQQSSAPLQSAEYFMYSCALVKAIIAETKGTSHQIDPDDVMSLFYLPPSAGGGADGRCLNYKLANFLLKGNSKALEKFGVPNKLNIVHQYQRAFTKLANADGQVSVMLIRPKFDPMGVDGQHAAKAIREKVLPKFRGLLQIKDDAYAADTNFFSALALMMDVQSQLYSAAPRILGLTVLAMFSLIAFMFGSAFAPVKLFLTVLVPLTFVYGAAIAVFQNGALNFLGMDQFSEMGGLAWEMPLLTFCVLMGLALDYDIFLFSRVVEYRAKGYDNRSAVVKGMAQSGPVISAAGLIMAIAFSGNMMGPFGYDNQIGFIMCIGVLVDTFVVRMCLVPCFLCMLESLNYWPVKMPVPTKMDKCLLPGAKDEDFEEEEEE